MQRHHLRRSCVCSCAIAALSSIAHAGPCAVSPSPSWVNAVAFPDDPFAVAGSMGNLPKWIKFTILTCDPETVYFQDSNTYAFHYDFATTELDPFIGLSHAQFDQVSLYAGGQQAVLGAVLFPGWDPDSPPPGGFPQEFGIQLVRQDAYLPQQVIDYFHTVRQAVTADPAAEAFYFPTFEQAAIAEAFKELLETNGVKVSNAGRWSLQNPIYAPGWGIGELVFVPGDQIDQAYVNGTLGPADILLTDGVPAEVPFVTGIISLAPSTPNSHVAILAETFNVPFVHLALEADAAAAEALVGNRVILRASVGSSGNNVTLVDVEGVLDEATINQLIALKQPLPLDITPKAPLGAYSAPVASLDLDDVDHFGGKASNYALLLDAIPANTRVATAFSFDLWDAFMAQPHGDGTLASHIDGILSAYTWPPEDMVQLAADLDAIRLLIRNPLATDFDPALQTAVLNTLQDPRYGFDPMANIRFRSSTNVEDGEQFSGAGLYESKSGCLADDLDGDAIGPSLCDSTEGSERSVFRAIRHVFASFYNDNAFLERLRHSVNESEVGMAILSHHSFPDPTEMANGVGTYELRFVGDRSTKLVSQTGAVSVTNPEGPSIPEEANLDAVYVPWSGEVTTYSNLVLLGTTVMDFPSEYTTLAGLFDSVSNAWSSQTGITQEYKLDFEYKKIAPGGDLVVKQVRQVPQPTDAPAIYPFLVNQPITYEVFQGESSNVLAVHRNKMRLTLQTHNLWLDPADLDSSIMADLHVVYHADCGTATLSGDPSTFDGAEWELDQGDTLDRWTAGDLTIPRTYELRAGNMIHLVPRSDPIVILGEVSPSFQFSNMSMEIEHAAPVPVIEPHSGVTSTTTDFVHLIPAPVPHDDDIFAQRTYNGPGGIVVNTSFFYFQPPTGIVAGYTAPVKRFQETVIEGLTTEPIVLNGFYSQSMRPEHHNFSENFLFDPFMEPGLPAEQLQELIDLDVRAIYINGSQVATIDFMLLSFDFMTETCPPPCLGDTDGSGAVDVDDLVAVILAWGTSDPNADVNADGTVDVDDIVTVILAWGRC